ncbi:uncharacterized protein LOC118169289 [Oxyura jamaicensis]|uniref:uncharacterized protein LOC118169289 n=1 Tax=Oxyura jamaicensis TaxID=8884 RepID=UPI0015A6846C|nr:uncharacterized protein LOC118169289 [Oxyura jamaicensis]
MTPNTTQVFELPESNSRPDIKQISYPHLKQVGKEKRAVGGGRGEAAPGQLPHAGGATTSGHAPNRQHASRKRPCGHPTGRRPSNPAGGREVRPASRSPLRCEIAASELHRGSHRASACCCRAWPRLCGITPLASGWTCSQSLRLRIKLRQNPMAPLLPSVSCCFSRSRHHFPICNRTLQATRKLEMCRSLSKRVERRGGSGLCHNQQ